MGVISYFQQGKNYKEISQILEQNGIHVSVGSCFNIIKVWKLQKEKEPPMAPVPAPAPVATTPAPAPALTTAAPASDIKSNPSSALISTDITRSVTDLYIPGSRQDDIYSDPNADYDPAYDGDNPLAGTINPPDWHPPGGERIDISDSCYYNDVIKKTQKVEETSEESNRPQFRAPNTQNSERDLEALESSQDNKQPVEKKWPDFGPAWPSIQKYILNEKQQMRHREFLLREKENALETREKTLEKTRMELGVERQSIENIKNEVKIIQSKIDRVKPFLPLAEQLSNLTLNPEWALYCMSSWLNIIQQKMQSKNISLDVAATLIQTSLERYCEVERYQSDVQQLQQQLHFENGYAGEKLDAIVSVINLHKLGLSDSQIVEVARKIQIQNQAFNSVPNSQAQAQPQVPNGSLINNGQGHNYNPNNQDNPPRRAIQWPNLATT